MFWLSLVPSLAAGFLAPLPYNYYKLKKYGISCHWGFYVSLNYKIAIIFPSLLCVHYTGFSSLKFGWIRWVASTSKPESVGTSYNCPVLRRTPNSPNKTKTCWESASCLRKPLVKGTGNWGSEWRHVQSRCWGVLIKEDPSRTGPFGYRLLGKKDQKQRWPSNKEPQAKAISHSKKKQKMWMFWVHSNSSVCSGWLCQDGSTSFWKVLLCSTTQTSPQPKDFQQD